MPQHIRVELHDHPDGPTASAFDALGQLTCYVQAATKFAALAELELRLICTLWVPFTLHLDDRCAVAAPRELRAIVEAVNNCGMYVVTIFDEDGAYLCDAACCCHEVAMVKCLRRLGQVLEPGTAFRLKVEILNPNDGDA